MLDSTEIFRSGSMLIIAFFIIVIAKKLSSYFKSSSNELNDISNSHYWSDLDILLKVKNILSKLILQVVLSSK